MKIVASSVALRYHGADSWQGYTHERDDILRFIRDQRLRTVIFLAADVHYAALLRHPEGPYEAISGPLAAAPAQTARAAGRPGVLWSSAGRYNYGWLRIAGGEIIVAWWDDQNVLMHQTQIPVER